MSRAIYIDELWQRLCDLDPNMLVSVQNIKDAISECEDVDVPCVSCKNCSYKAMKNEQLYCNYWDDVLYSEETYCDHGIPKEVDK